MNSVGDRKNLPSAIFRGNKSAGDKLPESTGDKLQDLLGIWIPNLLGTSFERVSRYPTVPSSYQ